MLIAQSLIVLLYIGMVQPFEKQSMNNLELFNEFCVLLCSYQMLIFTSFVEEVEVIMNTGWALIATLCFNLIINMFLMLLITIKDMVSKIRKIRDKCKNRTKLYESKIEII